MRVKFIKNIQGGNIVNNKWNRYAMMLFGLVIFIGILSGCTGDKKNVAESENNNSANSDSPNNSDATKGLPDKFDPIVELTTVSSLGTSVSLPEGDDMSNNVWTRHLESEFGIKITNLWNAPPGEEYEKKVNLELTSGDIPDFFLVNAKQFADLVEADLIEDLTDVYEHYAPENVKTVMEEAGDEVLKAATVDGRLMAIPFAGKEQENASMLWIRKDWMENLDLPDPESMDDLLTIAEAFTEQDPDGNGKDDTFGLALDKNFNMVEGFFNGFHAYRDIWIKGEGDELVYSTIQPEMKEALAALQDMYAKGQIDPEYGVKDSSKVQEDYGIGKIGMAFGGRSAVGFKLQTPDAEWQAYPAPSVDSELTKLQHEVNIEGNNYWVVKKGTENPEAILKMMDFFLETFYFNTDDEVFEQFVDDGKQQGIWQLSPAKLYTTFNNVDIYKAISEVMTSDDADDVSNLTPHQRNFYGRIKLYLDGDMQWWDQYQGFGPEGSGPVLEQYIENDQFMLNEFYGAPGSVMSQRGATLEKIELEMMTDIIKGGSLDKFDEYVENWYKLGGEQITEEVNEWYKEQ